MSSETSLSEALITLRKRKWIVILLGLSGLIYGLYRAVSQPKLYEATGRIEVRAGSSNEYRVSQIYNLNNDSVTRLQSEVNILQSESLLLAVAKDLDLVNNRYFFGKGKALPKHYSLDDPSVRQAAIGTLSGGLKVSLVVKTDLIRISYSSLSPQLSADIVNKLIAEYIQRSFETRYASTQHVSQWLSRELDDLRREVESSQEKMMDAQRRLGIIGLDPTHSQVVTGVEDLARASGDARIARILAESRYRALSQMGTDAVEPSRDDGGIRLSGGSSRLGPDVGVAPGTAPTTPAIGGPGMGTVSGPAAATGYGSAAASRSAARGANGTLPDAGSNTVQSMRGSVASLQAELAETEITLGPNHPTVKALKAQIAELNHQLTLEQQRMVTASREAYMIAKSTETQTTSTLANEENNAYKLRDTLVDYSLRQREYESNRALYDALRQRLRTAGVQAGLESVEIDVVDPALPPSGPVASSRASAVIIALLLSLMVGAGLAFLLESLDTGLRSINEIEAITQLPSLAIIPRTKRSGADGQPGLSTAQRMIHILNQPKSQFAEAIRSLRTSLLLSSTGKPPQVIVFTSATPAEGKTTTASNLACVLAQGESTVLLIDADLRRPNMHHRFGLNGKVGVTTLLTGSSLLENTMQSVAEVPNLHILPSGPIPPFPTEMLSSKAMEDLLTECRKLYTHIVIDTPPVLSVTDAVLLARQADAVALVIRQGKSSKHVVRRARDLLLRSGAAITGIVLNAVDLNGPEYYGYYGYTGYSYSGVESGSWERGTVGTKRTRDERRDA